MTGLPEQSNTSSTSSARNYVLVPVLTLGTFVAMLNGMALGPFLPVIAADLNTSISLLGQVPAVTMLLAAFLGLLIGPFADQYGSKRVLLFGLGIAAVSSLGIEISQGYFVLLIAALVGAGSRAISQPISLAVAGSRFEGDEQRKAISWIAAGAMGAVIIGIPAMTTIAEMSDWRIAFFVLATGTALLLAVTAWILEADGVRSESWPSIGAVFDTYRPLLKHHPTMGLIGSSLLSSIAIWMIATYLGAFYSDVYGFTIQQIGWVYLVTGISLFTGALAVGGRLGSYPLRPLVLGTRIVMGVAMMALFSAPISALFGVGLLAIQGLSIGVAGVATVVLLTRESPAGRATTLTLNVAAMSLGTALGSAIGGLLLAVTGFWLIGMGAFLLGFLSAMLVWWYQDSPIVTPPPLAPEAPA